MRESALKDDRGSGVETTSERIRKLLKDLKIPDEGPIFWGALHEESDNGILAKPTTV